MAAEVQQHEVKQAIEDLARAFEAHKKANDARLEALKAEKGSADFDEKLVRIGEVMDKQEKVIRDFNRQQESAAAKREAEQAAWRVEQEEHGRKVEARINRLALGLGGKGDERDSTEALKRKTYGEFLRRGTERMSPDEVKVLTVSNDITGGYLAPATFAQEIIKAVVLVSPMRMWVTVRPSGSTEFQQPKRTQTAAATWAGETATRSETQNVNWGLVKIPVHECYAEARISWANLEDSAFDLEGLLRDEFAEQFGVAEGTAIINGTGVGKPLGFLDANAAGPSTPIAYTPSGQAATIAGAAAGSAGQADPLISMFHAVKTAYAKNGVWCLNRASLGKVRTFKDTTGQYLWQPGVGQSGALTQGMAPTILGAPYCECPDMPDEASNAFPIAFGDWKRAYTLVERIDITVVRDNLTLASNGQVKFFARRRIGGQVVLGEAIRLLKCATS